MSSPTTLIYPFANAAYRQVTQAFGPTSNTAEPPYPDNAGTQLWVSTNGARGTRPQIAHYHRGVDFAVPNVTPLLAAAAGTVEFAGWDPYADSTGGYGYIVSIQHANGWATLYAHLNSPQVAQGVTVAQGDPFALSGSSGNATGPHLHFGLNLLGTFRNDSGWTNPIPELGDAAISNPVPFTQGGGQLNSTIPGYVTLAQAVYYARAAGFPEAEVATAVAVAQAESSLRIGAIGPTTSSGTPYGLWQIESEHGYDKTKLLTDPLYNARAAYAIWQQQGWERGWESYSTGRYLQYLPAAKTALEQTPFGKFPATDPATSGAFEVSTPVDTTPELPVTQVDIRPVVIDRSRLVRKANTVPTAALEIAGVLIPVETCSFTEPQYRTAGSWQATTSVDVFDRIKDGEQTLNALFARVKTQCTIRMGFVPKGRTGKPNPHDAPPVFVGLAYIPEIDDSSGKVTFGGPDLSGIFSDQSATASTLKKYVNLPIDRAIRTIVNAHFTAHVPGAESGTYGITVAVDPVAGTVGGLMGQDAVQTRTSVRTEWDLLLQLADGQGMVLYFQGTRLIARRVPEATPAQVLYHRMPGKKGPLVTPKWKAQVHTKRDVLVYVYSYNTRRGQRGFKVAGNHDSPDVVEINASPNRPADQLQARADAVLAIYSSTEYQANLAFVEPVELDPASPIVIMTGAPYSLYARVTGTEHPYYAVQTTTSYDASRGGITMNALCTNRPPAVQTKNTASSVSV